MLAGKVEGELCYSTAGRIYSSFNGIPYAKPPVGARRLLKPEAPESWDGVKKCNKNMTFIQLNAFRSVFVLCTVSLGTDDMYIVPSCLGVGEKGRPVPLCRPFQPWSS